MFITYLHQGLIQFTQLYCYFAVTKQLTQLYCYFAVQVLNEK